MKVIKLSLGILFMLSLLPGCKMYQEVEVLEVQNVEVTEFSEDLVEVEVELLVDNPNWYNVKIVESDLDLFLNKIVGIKVVWG